MVIGEAYDYDARYSEETSSQFKAVLYPTQRQKLQRVSEMLGKSQGKVLREALERFCDSIEGVEDT